jgi:3-phosphoglycerate kinase
LGEEENFWKARQMLDHSWIKKTVKELKFCMERMVNRVFLIGNLGERSGRPRGENSMRIIQHALQQHIDDFPIHFLADANMPDFLEKKMADEFHDNCVYVVENLNFHPEEFGTFEPKVEENEEKEGEKAEDEKGEEEVKRLASREKGSRGDASMKKLTSNQQLLSEEKEHEEDQEEEAVPVVAPPFTSETIHKFKKNLGNFGDIYVNDAPLASLTTSNTINEVQCPQKVMGMHMTEGLRNIAQFFMKQFPLDVDSIYVKKPNKELEYYQCKSAAIIGGTFKSSQEMLEKILLANSFLDTFERIFFVGEMGNLALFALGLGPG